jgi:hypothetical protein
LMLSLDDIFIHVQIGTSIYCLESMGATTTAHYQYQTSV